MKILSRTLVILAVGILIGAALYALVSATGIGARPDGFRMRDGSGQFNPPPDGPGGFRPDGGRDHMERGGGPIWALAGLLKNFVIVGLIALVYYQAAKRSSRTKELTE